MTLIDWLQRAAAREDCGLRFVDRSEHAFRLSWNEVRQRAAGLAGALQALGIRRGERIALILSTSPEFFDAFFGTLLAGAVPVPLYPPVRLGRLDEYHRETARMLSTVDARLVLSERRVKRLLGETIRLARPALGCRTPDELGAAPLRQQPIGADDLALVQFSSGTTLHPKPVALTHRAIAAQVLALNAMWPDTPELRHSGVSWLPLFHDMGLIGCVFTALERPAVTTLIPPELFVARPAVWLRAISRYRATISPAPNFAYARCVDAVRDQELDGVDLSCWKVALNGAETVVPTVIRAFAERFARWGFDPAAMTPVYGLSEAALAVTFDEIGAVPTLCRLNREALAAEAVARDDPEGIEVTSVGRPLPGFGLRIVGAEGNDLDERRVGRIWVSGPSLMRGYLDRPGATSRALRDGWLDTGDLGFVLDGRLYLTGRVKDMLLLRGRNHAPEPVEHAADAVPGVRKGCSVAVSRLVEGEASERLMLFVEARRGIDRSAHPAIALGCAEQVLSATGLRVDQVVVLVPGTLPRTSSGKLRRAETLARWIAGKLDPPRPVNPVRISRALAGSLLSYARWGLGHRGPAAD